MPNTKPNNAPVTSSVFVALVGRPNVGKSSLTNHLVGEKVAIVTQKPQTTRNRITGIITKGPVQYVLLDTPGIHKPRNRLDSRMTQTAAASLKDVDVTLMLFEPAGAFTDSELNMVEALRKAGPAIAVINKVDLLTDFAALEARKKQVEAFGVFDSVTAVSAKDGTGCEPTPTPAPTILTTKPSPICPRRSWWPSWCGRRRCSICVTKSPTASPSRWRASRSAPTRTSLISRWKSAVNARATKA